MSPPSTLLDAHETPRTFPDFRSFRPLIPSVPLYHTVRKYNLSLFQHDLLAGLTIAILVLPQGMAYASIASLPPVYGLYAAIVPIYMYAIFGASKYLSVAMIAVNSLILSSGISTLADPDTEMEKYIDLALIASIETGIISLLMGVFKLGFIVDWVSPTVVSGFTGATVITIVMTQIESLFGIKVPKSEYSIIQFYYIFAGLGSTKWLAVVNGLVNFFILYLIRRWNRRFPNALVAVVLSTLLSFLLSLQSSYWQTVLPIVGTVPAGLPKFHVPVGTLSDYISVIQTAAILHIVGFMQTVAVNAKMSELAHEEGNNNQDLFAIGVSHLIGAFFQAADTNGSFSRSMVGYAAGAKTQMTSIIAATLVIVSLLGITPLFYWIPKSTLGAIVIFAVAPMFELKILRRAMQISFGDAMAGCITFVVTVLTKVQWGILIGFAACVSLHLSKESGAQTQVLGWLPNKGVGEGYHVWKSTGHRLMEAQEIDHVLVWRVEGPIWFGNARVIKEAFFSLWKTKKPKRRRVSTQDGLIPQIPLAYKAVIFDMSNVNDVDYSGMENLLDMIRHLKKQKLKVLLSGMNQTVGGMFMKKIISLESIEKNPLITAEMMFFNIACAIEYCKDLEEPFEAFSIQEA